MRHLAQARNPYPPIVVMDSGLARSLSSGRASRGPVGAPRNDEKAGIAPGLLYRYCVLLQFSEARFGGEAGHDLIRVS
jgi:hypothetical protein